MTDVNHLGQALGEAVPDWVPPPFPSHQPIEGRYCRLEPLRRHLHAVDLWAAYARDVGRRNEGVFRQMFVNKGRNRDTAWYACIDKEWPALRAAFERWLVPDMTSTSTAVSASASHR